MVLGFMIPTVPEVVITGERDRKQHFEAYKRKKKTGIESPFAEVNEDGNHVHHCDCGPSDDIIIEEEAA